MNHGFPGIELIVTLTIGGIAVLNAVILWLMPRLTRPDLYFAVTVPLGFRDGPAGKSILKRYRFELVLVSLIALSIFIAGVAWLGVVFASQGSLLEIFAGFIVFYLARKRTLPYAVSPTVVREAELRGHDRVIPGGWIAMLGPFGLLALCAGYFWWHGADTHRLTVYLLSTSGLLGFLTLVLYGLSFWVRPVYASGPERVRELKFRRTVSIIVLGSEFYLTLQATWVMFMPRHQPLMAAATLPLALVFVLIVAVVLVRLGQGGSRLIGGGKRLPVSGQPVGDRTPDHYWKLGVFYFNPDDSAVFVEKRFGIGYSLNFARPITWIILTLLLMAPVVAILAHLTRFLPKGGG
jgi:uncharacterized membrane protein